MDPRFYAAFRCTNTSVPQHAHPRQIVLFPSINCTKVWSLILARVSTTSLFIVLARTHCLLLNFIRARFSLVARRAQRHYYCRGAYVRSGGWLFVFSETFVFRLANTLVLFVLPWTRSARVSTAVALSLLSRAGALCGRSPSTLSSLLRQ